MRKREEREKDGKKGEKRDKKKGEVEIEGREG